MNGFTLYLLDATHSEQIENVTSFTGEDATGSFGLLANHSRFMTVLSLGIAKFRVADGAWKYLAVPGGVVYFQNNRMTLCSYRFLMDDDYHRIHEALNSSYSLMRKNYRHSKPVCTIWKKRCLCSFGKWANEK